MVFILSIFTWQENKDPQVQLGAQSQADSALTSLDHVIADPAWAMTIGM